MIVFSAGCFWCTEAVFKDIKGVISVTPGYTGGKKPNPTYENVCSGDSGHAEAIKVEYDPNEISIRDLLTVFFATHDPTQKDGQGNDIGSQYRSAVFYLTEEQKEAALKMITEIDESTTEGGKVVTEVERFDTFYPAEDYHRDYFAKNPEQAYCKLVINPKIEKVQKHFAELLRKK